MAHIIYFYIAATFQNLDKEGHGLAAFDIDNVCNLW